MGRDLTKGPVIGTLIAFAVPMILGDLLQQCYNIADTLIVGQFLGTAALGAVGSAFSLMTFITSIILGLAMGSGTTKGVDADVADAVTEETLDQAVAFVKHFAKETGTVIAITGAIDLVSDGRICYVIRNGRPEMGRITGTGCQLSGMMTAYITVNPEHVADAAAAAVCAMGLAGETGWSRMQEGDGNATYRNRIIDAIYNMTGEELEKGAKYEIR